jgi:hypothetical protein
MMLMLSQVLFKDDMRKPPSEWNVDFVRHFQDRPAYINHLV